MKARVLRGGAILCGGSMFGFGLALSGMSRPEVVLDFLHLDDLGLLLVMGGAILVTLPIYQGWKKPILATHPETFRAGLNGRTIAGSAIFGIGWGISGVCPGAAFASLGTGNHRILVAVAAMFLGAFVQGRWLSERSEPLNSPSPENRR